MASNNIRNCTLITGCLGFFDDVTASYPIELNFFEKRSLFTLRITVDRIYIGKYDIDVLDVNWN